MKSFFLFIVLLLCLTLQAGKIELRPETSPYRIVNHNNHKIYNYQMIEPGKMLHLKVKSIDSLEIFSRAPMNNRTKIDYQYQISWGDSSVTIHKSAKKSNVSRGINGENVSTYNKHTLPIAASIQQITIKNRSNHELFMKFDADKFSRTYRTIDYVSLSPEHYQDEVVLQISEDEYTYYSTNSHHVSFSLEGPMRIKIISRLLFDDTLTHQQTYRYQIIDNGKKEVEYLETANKSQKAKLLFESDKGVSTGDVHFYEIGTGIHEIALESPDQNREVIFRIYIDKAAIGTKK